MARPTFTWNGAVYYGEVIGFALAWVTGIAVASHYAAKPVLGPTPDRIAAVDGATLPADSPTNAPRR